VPVHASRKATAALSAQLAILGTMAVPAARRQFLYRELMTGVSGQSEPRWKEQSPEWKRTPLTPRGRR